MSELYSGIGLKYGLIGTGVLSLAFFIVRLSSKDCLKPELQADFDVSQYTGVWYEFEKTPNPFQKGECTTATYTLQSNGKVEVHN